MPGNALFSVLVFFTCFSRCGLHFWLHFGAPNATLELSKSILFRKRVQGGLQEAFWIDLGTQGEFQEAFWIDFETMWVHLGWVLGGLGENLEGFGAQPSAQKYAIESLSQVGGIGRKASTIARHF